MEAWCAVGEMLSDLSEAELEAVVAFFHAVVRRDRARLEDAGAYDEDADPFMYVDDYYDDCGTVLAVPPGNPRSWYGGSVRSAERPDWVYVMVDMYDEQSGANGQPGENDLTLELNLTTDAEGRVTVEMLNLHVM